MLVPLKVLSDRFCCDPFENTKSPHQLDLPYSETADSLKELFNVSMAGLSLAEATVTYKK